MSNGSKKANKAKKKKKAPKNKKIIRRVLKFFRKRIRRIFKFFRRIRRSVKKVFRTPPKKIWRIQMRYLRKSRTLFKKDLKDFRRWASWYISPTQRSSRRKIKMLRNKHKGERCFIIGNGPSLKDMDLSLLENELTFGLNRIYILMEERNFSPSYFVSINGLVLSQFGDEISKLTMPKFINWNHRKNIKRLRNTIFLRQLRGMVGFSEDLRKGYWSGATVTHTALQIAYYMGFKEVILIGVDHNFTTKGEPHLEVSTTENDVDHFSEDYFGKGVRWQLPDLETSELAYQVSKFYFERKSRQILDATVGGKLEVFEKVDYLSLFDKETD